MAEIQVPYELMPQALELMNKEIAELRKLVRFFAGGLMAAIVSGQTGFDITDENGLEIWQATLEQATDDGIDNVFRTDLEDDLNLSDEVFRRAVNAS